MEETSIFLDESRAIIGITSFMVRSMVDMSLIKRKYGKPPYPIVNRIIHNILAGNSRQTAIQISKIRDVFFLQVMFFISESIYFLDYVKLKRGWETNLTR